MIALVDRLDLAVAELFAARRAQLVQDVGRGVLDIEQAQTPPSEAAVGIRTEQRGGEFPATEETSAGSEVWQSRTGGIAAIYTIEP